MEQCRNIGLLLLVLLACVVTPRGCFLPADEAVSCHSLFRRDDSSQETLGRNPVRSKFPFCILRRVTAALNYCPVAVNHEKDFR